MKKQMCLFQVVRNSIKFGSLAVWEFLAAPSMLLIGSGGEQGALSYRVCVIRNGPSRNFRDLVLGYPFS